MRGDCSSKYEKTDRPTENAENAAEDGQAERPSGARPVPELSRATVDELFAIGSLVGRFGQVERLTQHEDGEPERDTTHTVMLALVAAQLAAHEGLDQHEVVMHALVHDLPEAYAGDTPTLRPLSTQERAEKDAREAAAVERITTETPYLGTLVRAYEARQSRASRFVWVLDKAMPKITHAWNGCAVPKRQGMGLDELRANHENQADLLHAKAPDVPVAHAFFAACCEHAERAYLSGAVELCRLPIGSRVRWRNKHRATSDELEWFVGTIRVGVTGPGEGIMVEMDHTPAKRWEVNPYQLVELVEPARAEGGAA